MVKCYIFPRHHFSSLRLIVSKRYFTYWGRRDDVFSTPRWKTVYATPSLWIQRCCSSSQNPSCVHWKLKGQQSDFWDPLMKRPFEITSLSLKRCSITPTCFPTSFWAALYKRECDLNKMWWFFTHWQAPWKHSIIKSVPSRYYKLRLFKSMQKRLHELGTARMTNDLGWLKKIRALSFK